MSDTPAILGGAAVRDDGYPGWPQWDSTERDGLLNVLESGEWWTTGGDQAEIFAREFAQFQGASIGFPMTNGTHTLEAALAACDVGEGDEVLVAGLTFIASASAVLAVNAKPILIDVDARTLCMDPAAAEAAITPATKAIVVVHVAGAAADLDAFVDICRRHNLRLIEDCAHAHGTTWRGRGVGSWGDFGSFSFQQGKLMTAGEGGALITSNEELALKAFSYWNCGRVIDGWFYHHPRYGSNLRMTEWQGAVLRAQLARFPEQNRTRNANAIALGGALAEIPGLEMQYRDPRMESQGNYCYIFHYDKAHFAGMPLAVFEESLEAEGIPMGVSYPSLSRLELFRTGNFGARNRALSAANPYANVSLPVAEHAAESTVWIEHRVLLGEREDVLDVARAAARIHASAADIVKSKAAA